jgi:hypothetical protein
MFLVPVLELGERDVPSAIKNQLVQALCDPSNPNSLPITN